MSLLSNVSFEISFIFSISFLVAIGSLSISFAANSDLTLKLANTCPNVSCLDLFDYVLVPQSKY